MTARPYQPVIILGAARSGTNILRDCMTRLDGFATWDCDEINAIWRHGNLDWPNDAIPPENATEPVVTFIRQAFDRLWQSASHPAYVVEKTCANTLRVPFVDKVMPDAKFVEILRHPGDVIPSAMKRWSGEMEFPQLPYLWAKLRYVPPSDLPHYATAFIRNRLSRFRDAESRLKVWGPRFVGQEGLKDVPLAALCAHQWLASVERCRVSLEDIAPERRFRLTYEDFVSDPAAALRDIAGWLGASPAQAEIEKAVAPVKRRSDGAAPRSLPDFDDDLTSRLKTELKLQGYPV